MARKADLRRQCDFGSQTIGPFRQRREEPKRGVRVRCTETRKYSKELLT